MFWDPETDLNQEYLFLLNRYFHKVHTLPFTALSLGIRGDSNLLRTASSPGPGICHPWQISHYALLVLLITMLVTTITSLMTLLYSYSLDLCIQNIIYLYIYWLFGLLSLRCFFQHVTFFFKSCMSIRTL